MPTANGKIYLGASLVAEPGMQWEYDRPYPVDYGTTDTYTIPGSLIQTFTTSGTYTPGVGVTAVDVVVIGGGGNGAKSKEAANQTGCGGSGGGVRVYRNVPVSGDVTVTIGGAGTASSFGALSAPGGMHAAGINGHLGAPGLSRNIDGLGNGGAGGLSSSAYNSNNLDYGQPGPSVNGTRYGGGGGGCAFGRGWGAPANGGSGGGGSGVRYDSGGWPINPVNGTAGYGGGGGGANYSGNGSTPGVGGTGRVMIYGVA